MSMTREQKLTCIMCRAKIADAGSKGLNGEWHDGCEVVRWSEMVRTFGKDVLDVVYVGVSCFGVVFFGLINLAN